MDYPSILLPALESMFRIGQRACAEMERARPEVVIGLAHSGWRPVVVTRALWEAEHASPFPPALRTNLGQEKHSVYHQRFTHHYPAYCCGECSNSPDRVGHFLAWLAEQKDWVDFLQHQVESICPHPPTRILIMDDVYGGYRTCYLALGLLESAYPQAQVSMLAGTQDLTNEFVHAWLGLYVPQVAQEIPVLLDTPSSPRYASPWFEQLKPLITGSEDVAPESLDWRPLQAESQAVQAINGQVALEIVLATPAWADGLACQYALERQRGNLAAPEVENISDPFCFSPRQMELEPVQRLLGWAWRNNGLSRQEMVAALDASPGGLPAWLKANLTDYAIQGRGRWTRYYPEAAQETWITYYDFDLFDSTPPVFGWAEFLPTRLWSGATPKLLLETQVEMFADLQKAGIQQIVDLTAPGEMKASRTYLEALHRASARTGVMTGYTRFSLPFHAVPTRKRMASLLQLLQSFLDTGQGVYLHAGHNLEGRAPMVLSCLLIQHGHSPAQALEQVTDFWMKTLPFLIRMPLSDKQRQFVLRWQASPREAR